MNDSSSYSPAALCALINSGRVRLPLSRTRTLDVLAALEGAANWNVIAHSADAGVLKGRAWTLMKAVNARLVGDRISEAASADALAEMMALPPSQTAQVAKTSAPPSVASGELRPITLVPTGEPHEWRWKNPNRTLPGDELARYLHDGAANRAHLSGTLMMAWLDGRTGDVALAAELATVLDELGDKDRAKTVWEQTYLLFIPALDALWMSPQGREATASFQAQDNQPFYRVISAMVSLWGGTGDKADLSRATKLAVKAFNLSREYDALGFRVMAAEGFARLGEWALALEQADYIASIGLATFATSAIGAAAACMLNQADAEQRFNALIDKYPVGVEVLSSGLGARTGGLTSPLFREAAEHLSGTGDVWDSAPLQTMLQRLLPALPEAGARRSRTSPPPLPGWLVTKQQEIAAALQLRLDAAGVRRRPGQIGAVLAPFAELANTIEDSPAAIATAREDVIRDWRRGASSMAVLSLDGKAADACSVFAARMRHVVDRETFLRALDGFDEVLFLNARESAISQRMAAKVATLPKRLKETPAAS